MTNKWMSMGQVFVAGALSLACLSSALAADDFPSRPIKLIVPYSPGSSADISARRVGDAMSRTLGKPIVVENIAGAGGVVGRKKTRTSYLLLTGADAGMAPTADAAPKYWA